MKKRFHITWFVNDKKDKLSGITVEAKDIIEAIKMVSKSKIPTENNKFVNSEIIKYVLEI